MSDGFTQLLEVKLKLTLESLRPEKPDPDHISRLIQVFSRYMNNLIQNETARIRNLFMMNRCKGAQESDCTDVVRGLYERYRQTSYYTFTCQNGDLNPDKSSVSVDACFSDDDRVRNREAAIIARCFAVLRKTGSSSKQELHKALSNEFREDDGLRVVNKLAFMQILVLDHEYYKKILDGRGAGNSVMKGGTCFGACEFLVLGAAIWAGTVLTFVLLGTICLAFCKMGGDVMCFLSETFHGIAAIMSGWAFLGGGRRRRRADTRGRADHCQKHR